MTYPPPGSPGEQDCLESRAFPPPPPAQPEKTGPRPKVALVAVLVGAIGVLGYLVVNQDEPAVPAEQGDCIKVVSAADARTERADCGAREAVYQVAKKLDTAASCPQGEYSELTSGNTVKLCLMLNAVEGDCFKMTSAGRNQIHERVPCDSAAEYKVLKVITGKAEKAACAQGNVVATYAEPATTICLAATS